MRTSTLGLNSMVGLICLLVALPAQASYMAECKLDIRVDSVTGTISKDKKRSQFTVKATFTVTHIISQSGHLDNHCKDFPGKEFTDVLQAKSRELILLVKPGALLTVLFTHVDSEIADENGKFDFKTFITWDVLGPAQPTPKKKPEKRGLRP